MNEDAGTPTQDRSTAAVARQLRHVKMLLVGVLAAILLVGVGAYAMTRPEPDWSYSECIQASLSGSGYDRDDMVENGCFGDSP